MFELTLKGYNYVIKDNKYIFTFVKNTKNPCIILNFQNSFDVYNTNIYKVELKLYNNNNFDISLSINEHNEIICISSKQTKIVYLNLTIKNITIKPLKPLYKLCNIIIESIIINNANIMNIFNKLKNITIPTLPIPPNFPDLSPKSISIKKINPQSISIITLVRNNKEYLKTSVSSLLKQTNQNWENIIINDGSTYEIEYEDFLTCEELIEYKNKIKIINLSNWQGIVKCHKIGIINAQYDIVGILDVDDTLHETAIEKVLNIYETTREENIFVYTNFYYCDNLLNILNKGYASQISKDSCLLNDRCGNHFKSFLRKYYYLTSGFDDDLLFGAEDQDILFKLEEYCKPIYLNECLYYYRTYSKNNVTSSISCLKKASRYSYYLSILKNIMTRYKNINSYIQIYNNKDDIEYLNKQYNNNFIEKDGIKYYFELKSNNIYLKTLEPNLTILEKYLQLFIKTTQFKFPVSLSWNYKYNDLIPIDSSNINDSNNINDSSNIMLELNTFNKIHPNTYFDEIYIINMKHEAHKKERIQKIFGKYNIHCTFIEAVNGIEHMEEFNKTKLQSPGVYGYSMSMVKIFKDAIAKKHNKIWVCDDDIILHKNFDIKFDEYIKCIPYSWKVLYFGLSGPWQINQNTFLSSFNYDKKYTNNLTGCDGSFAVGYDKTMFKKIIKIAKKMIYPFDTQLIEYLNNMLSIEKYAFYPQIVIADTVKKSTIVNYEEETNIIQNIERNHLRFNVNLDNFDLESMENNKYYDLKCIKY